MERYLCHKEVNAKPMTRGEYNAYRGWETPDDEDPTDEGYLVEIRARLHQDLAGEIVLRQPRPIL